MWCCMRWVMLGLVVVGLRSVRAEDAFYQVPWSELELSEGRLPAEEEGTWLQWGLRSLKPPYAVLDGEGEVYVRDGSVDDRVFGGSRGRDSEAPRRTIVVRTPAARDVTGRLFAPTSDGASMVMVRFKIAASRANRDARRTFYELKKWHYDQLLAQGAPGAAWFRHESRQAQQALGARPSDLTADAETWSRPGTRDLEDTYALFTGGRAMSENLQLDRVLTPARGGQEAVELTALEGITVREIDWRPLVKDLKPELDPLASSIPADQHVIFFPTFNTAAAVADEIAAQGPLVLELVESRSTSARTLERYQAQLGLSITGLARLLGPTVVRSVAITGSDPYFRTGTDVAVLFEAADATALQTLLAAQIGLAAAANSTAKAVQGDVDGLAYQGVTAPDRSICSYLAKRDNLVIVTNSLYQLKQLVKVSADPAASLAALDEYTFFRHRYPRTDDGETALLFLSDATIRRWCGPRWRIAASRRTRDLAVVAELQAGQLDRLVAGQVEPGPLYTDLPLGENGQLTLTPQGVHCSTVGGLAFMTPIAEMDIARVTQAEADAYRQWRNRYQENWRWAFDPIALRIGVRPDRLSADLTIMPLIWGTEYRELISISQGAAIAPGAGDPHDALAHVVLALNTKSEMLQRQSGVARALTGSSQLDPLSWLGSSVAAYLDDGPFWEELARVEPDKRSDYVEKQVWRIPVAVRAEVSNGLKLTAFLTAVRGFIEQVAPGMLNWESLTYRDQPYVKITPTPRALGQTEELRDAALYYSASGASLVLTLNEDLLKQAVDRELARDQGITAGEEPKLPTGAWLGSNLALQADQKFLQVVAALGGTEYQRAMQAWAWSNLPILNEWKHRYADQDPVALHERYWQTRLVCPGGGQYVWNERWQTMESTVYGCPAAPKEGPLTVPALQAIKQASFGLTFEEQGLRARVLLDR